ncbi:MAG: hypothetical protein WDW38_002269 [Sanguina aurantia]
METLTLGALFAGWYAANIAFNIYNKQVLAVFPHPLTCTAAQFIVGSLIAGLLWLSGSVKRPTVNVAMLTSIAPLAVVHTLGNLLTNVSLGSVAVSFTHTIKAMEPFFSVLLSALFLGDKPSIPVLLTLIPIVGGVAVASLAEASFNWTGFLSAMGSNLTFQSRNVLSKKLMTQKSSGGSSGSGSGSAATPPPLDNISLFSIITVLSAVLLVPVALAREGAVMLPTSLEAAGVLHPQLLATQLAMSGLCFHAYQQFSYMILQRVSPVTHSIGNCVKRVIVIVASLLAFQNPMSMHSAVGTGVALLGVFAYSQIKRVKQKAA